MGRPWSRQALDRGQAIPALLLVVGLVGATAVGIGVLGAQLSVAGRVASAADAAALAGALHGHAAAAALAAANGARLVGWETELDPSGYQTVTVTVEGEGPIRATTAVGRARSEP